MMGHIHQIIAALESGVHSSRGIAQATGKPLESTQVRLAELIKLGAVRSYKMRDAGRGCPKFYRLVKP